MRSVSKIATFSGLFALSVLIPEASNAASLDGTYAGSYSSCTQGATGIVSSFITDNKGKAKLLATVYNIPGVSHGVATTMFEWTGKYDSDKLTFDMPNAAILGASNGFTVTGINGKYTGKKITWTFCGKAFTQSLISTNPKEVP